MAIFKNLMQFQLHGAAVLQIFSIICSTSRSPFYSLPTGENSCYWDISGAVLDSLGKNRESKYDYQRDVCHAIDDRFFGPETDYSLEKRQNYMQLRAMGMTPDQPIQGRFVYKLSLPLYFIFLDNCFFASSFISKTLYGVLYTFQVVQRIADQVQGES